MYVVCTMTGGVKLWYLGAGRWTPDCKGAKQYRFGLDSFQTSNKVWIEFAPK